MAQVAIFLAVPPALTSRGLTQAQHECPISSTELPESSPPYHLAGQWAIQDEICPL